MKRRRAREQAFIIIFAKSFNEDISITQLIDNAVELEIIKPDEFTSRLINGVFDNLKAVDEKIEENLIGWKKERISRVSAALLRLAIAEMLFFSDIPESVSINEAVELAKIYAPSDDAAFINGVLGSVAKKAGA